VWYPFDWTVSPFYELVNISQVKTFNLQTWHNSHKNYCIIHNWSVRLCLLPGLIINGDSSQIWEKRWCDIPRPHGTLNTTSAKTDSSDHYSIFAQLHEIFTTHFIFTYSHFSSNAWRIC
jgi:hypothetical protein